PSAFLDWKHRQSSDYLDRVEFTTEERRVLGILKIVPELDFEGIVNALDLDPADISEILLKLCDLHIVEAASERFMISPPLRIAVEKDRSLSLPVELQRRALRSLADTLSVRIEEGTAPIALIDTAVLASLESDEKPSHFAAAFLMPSHHVWLAKKHYDQQNFHDSIR